MLRKKGCQNQTREEQKWAEMATTLQDWCHSSHPSPSHLPIAWIHPLREDVVEIETELHAGVAAKIEEVVAFGNKARTSERMEKAARGRANKQELGQNTSEDMVEWDMAHTVEAEWDNWDTWALRQNSWVSADGRDSAAVVKRREPHWCMGYKAAEGMVGRNSGAHLGWDEQDLAGLLSCQVTPVCRCCQRIQRESI